MKKKGINKDDQLKAMIDGHLEEIPDMMVLIEPIYSKIKRSISET